MLTVLPLEPELCASADLTMREIHLFSATSTPVSRVLVVSMLTVQPQEPEQSVSAGVATLETLSPSAGWSHVPPVPVGLMLTALLLAEQQCASVSQAILVIHTQTAYLTLALAAHVGKELSVKTTEELLSVNVLHSISETRM